MIISAMQVDSTRKQGAGNNEDGLLNFHFVIHCVDIGRKLF